ncbi:MAG: hypothetical protein AAGM22_07485 [Acidobacteriota bacterium]
MTSPQADSTRTLLLRTSALLWIVWGLVHMLAGVMTLSQDTAGAIQGIADGVDPALIAMDYPAAAGGIINQHGFNLLWFGVVTVACAPFIWRGSWTGIWLAALVGGLADVGYFIFIDLGGFARFVPGTVMTIVSATAIITGFWADRRRRAAEST